MIIEFIASILCLLFAVAIIAGLYIAFKANDLFYAKLREYQKLSKSMFKEEKQRKSPTQKIKPKESKESVKVEDAEFREVN